MKVLPNNFVFPLFLTALSSPEAHHLSRLARMLPNVYALELVSCYFYSLFLKKAKLLVALNL